MTALADYLTDRLHLATRDVVGIEEADRWADHGTGEPVLFAHEWAGEGGDRHCTSCGLTYAESWGRPGPGHVACLARPVR